MTGAHVYERGTVKFYRPERGFGFIVPEDATADVFVHAKTLAMSGIETLNPGDRVEFERVRDNRGVQAYRVQLI